MGASELECPEFQSREKQGLCGRITSPPRTGEDTICPGSGLGKWGDTTRLTPVSCWSPTNFPLQREPGSLGLACAGRMRAAQSEGPWGDGVRYPNPWATPHRMSPSWLIPSPTPECGPLPWNPLLAGQRAPPTHAAPVHQRRRELAPRSLEQKVPSDPFGCLHPHPAKHSAGGQGWGVHP